MAALADGEFIVGDGTTDPVAESGDTARISLGLGTTDSPIFAGGTFNGDVTFSDGTQDYDFKAGNFTDSLAIVGKTSGSDSFIELYSNDGDETDKVGMRFYGKGTQADTTDSSYVDWYWQAASPYDFIIATGGTGTYTKRDIKIYSQQYINLQATDGIRIYDHLFPLDDGVVDLGDATHEYKDLYVDGTAYLDSIELATGHTISVVGSDMTFVDPTAGTLTLSEMSCPPMVDVSDTTVAEGYNDVALTASKVQIKWIEIATSSTDWTLTVYEDDDAPGANPREILSNQNGDVDFYWDYPYEDEDASDEFHYQFEDDQPVEDYCVAQWYLDDNAASTAVAEDVGDFTAVASDNTDTMTTTGPWGAANTAMAFDDATTDEIVITDNALLQLSPEFTDDSQSGDLNCHQGVAADATHIYTIDNDTIHKRYRITPYTSVDSITGFLATINTEHSPATDVDHSGDGAVWDGYLYIISEHYVDTTDNDHQFLVKFQTSDMTYVSSVDISANFAANVGGGNLCIINGIIYVTMYETVTTGVMRFKLDGTYIDTVTMGTPLTYIDGITYDTVEEIFYLRGDVDSYYRYDTSFNQLCKILENPTGECKGLDFTQSDLGLMVVIDEGVDEKIHFLSKGAGWAPGWTLTAWVLIDDTSDAYNGIICRGGPDDRTYCLSLDAGSDDVYGGYETDYGTPGTNKFAYSTDGQLDFATWYFLGCTWDGQTVTTWINGESAGTPLATNNLPVVEADPVEIGRTIQSSDYNFDGKIASASIFKRALNATEMLELFNQQSASYDLANSTMNQEHDIEVKGYKLR